MKRALLMLMAGALAGSVHGQTAQRSVMFNPSFARNTSNLSVEDKGTQAAHKANLAANVSAQNSSSALSAQYAAHRGTLGGGRWYNYVGTLLNFNATNAGGDISFAGLDIWNDTTAYFGYTGVTSGSPYEMVNFTSLGMSLNPFADQWNDTTLFGTTLIGLDRTKPYSIDSVSVLGWYNRSYASAAKIAVVDTLIISFVQGNGSSTSDLPISSFAAGGSTAGFYGLTGPLYYLGMTHDSLHNRAAGTTEMVYKILLHSTDTNNSNSGRGTTYPRASDPVLNYSVTAGNFVSASITFKSGDNAYYTSGLLHDTVRYSDGTTVLGYKYGTLRPELAFAVTTPSGTTAAWAPYVSPDGDLTSGYFKREGAGDAGWGGEYIPHWPWHTTSGSTAQPSELQYPIISYHVQCPTCVLVGTPSLQANNVAATNSVKVYPNPANNEVRVAFTMANASDVKVALVNALGQTVATQNLSNTASGTAVFNTASLASGVYMYVIDANGTRSTGRVSVAH